MAVEHFKLPPAALARPISIKPLTARAPSATANPKSVLALGKKLPNKFPWLRPSASQAMNEEEKYLASEAEVRAQTTDGRLPR